MVSALDSWPGSLCCVLRRDTLLSQCFSSPRCTNGYQQMCWGVNLRWTCFPSSSNTPSRFMLRKPELSTSSMGHLYRIIFTLSLLQSEPICAIGHGVAGLCSARREDGKSWSFKSFSMTGVSTGSVWYFQYIIITPLSLHLGWFHTSRTWHRLVDQLMKLWTLLNLFLGQYWKNAKRKGKKKESQRGEV